MNQIASTEWVKKLPTYITGFDQVSYGGLPAGRTTLLAGSAGSAKTVFAAQYIAAGIREANQPGVFVTFEETPGDISRNMQSLGWPIQQWVEGKKWAFVDASPEPEDETFKSGSYDLGALLARIEHAVRRIHAKRIAVDSLGAIFSRFDDAAVVRRELLRISTALKNMGITSLLTAERIDEYGDIARFGIEEFVSDNVIILRNALEDEKRRRTLEILKMRGTSHQKGEFPFTILSNQGVVLIPLSAIELKQRSSSIRVSTGNESLNKMCGGGFFRDSIILVSGATGTGKTLMTTEFIGRGSQPDDRCLLFAFEESREQLIRNAAGWGVDFERMEEEGRLRVVAEYPEMRGLEDHFISMRDEIEAFGPTRIAIDSLSALERVSTLKGFREFVIGITSLIKHKEVVGLFTATSPSLVGGASVTEAHISTITDTIILLRYVEMFGEMRRGVTVLKMRGSMHEKAIREFLIDDRGMHIGDPFRNVTGILTGQPMYAPNQEMERIGSMFAADESEPRT